MSTITDQLTTLRESLRDVSSAENDSFHRVFSKFLDLTRDTELIADCEPIEDDPTRAFVEHVLRIFTNKPHLKLEPMPIFQHLEAGMVHGPVVLGKRTGGFFFFREENQGLLALTDKRGLTDYLRISAIPVPANSVAVSVGADLN